MNMYPRQISIKLTEEDYQAVVQIAKEQERDLAFIARKAVIKMLKDKRT